MNRKSVQAALALSIAAAIAGCATGMQKVERPPFNEAEYQALAGRTGTGVVTGQVFMTTRGGDVKFGAGSRVNLNPDTSYSEFYHLNAVVGGKMLEDPDPRIIKYVLSTQADGMGNFTFENVPPGDYYVTSAVTWEVPSGYYSTSKQGGLVGQKITVENGKPTKVMLTR